MDAERYARQLQERTTEIADHVAALPRHSMWTADALMARGGDPEAVVEATRRTLGGTVAGGWDADMGGPFHILPAMLLYCRWEERLPAAAIDMVRRFMLEGVLERGNTENHWLMYYTGNLLAAERWADEPRLWDGRPPEAMRREARRWILGTIERTARIGHHEYDSPGYHIEHMAPLVGLVEHTRDEELRTQVDKVLKLLVADMALEFYKGSWAGSHSREGYRENTWTRVGPPVPSSPVNSMAKGAPKGAAPKSAAPGVAPTAAAPAPKTTGAANPAPAPAPKAAPGGQKQAAAAQQPADIGDICLLPDIARFAH